MLLKHFIKKHWQEGEESFELPAVSSEEKVCRFAVAEWVCVLYSVIPQDIFILLEGIKTFKVHCLVCSKPFLFCCLIPPSWWFCV